MALDLCALDLVQNAIRDHQAANCAEFWLNRYQSLFSGMLALGTAVIAAVLLQRQLLANRIQASAATGDVDPDFSLEWDTAGDVWPKGALEDAILRIQNYNRRPISVRRIEAITPLSGFSLKEFNPGPHGPIDIRVRGSEGSAYDLNRWIEGRDPVGAVVIDVIRITLVSQERPERSGEEEPVAFLIDYNLLGNPTDKRQVEVRGLVQRR